MLHNVFKVFLMLAFFSHPALSKSISIKGIWLTQKEEKNAKIEITECENNLEKVCGKIVWLESEAKKGSILTDENNDDPPLQKRRLLGLMILENFKQINANTWEEGTIYNPEDSKTYSCTMQLIKNDENQEVLRVRGYVGVELFGKSQDWIRASAQKAPALMK